MKKRVIAALLCIALLLPMGALGESAETTSPALLLMNQVISAVDFETKLSLLEAAVALEPDNPETLTECAQMLFYFDTELAHTALGEQWLRHAADLRTGDARFQTLVLLADRLIAADKADEAVALFAEEAERFPDNPLNQVVLANSMYYQKNVEGALALLETLMSEAPDNEAAARLYATLLLAECRFEEALATFKGMETRFPESLEGLYGQFQTYTAMGEFDRAMRAVDKMLLLGSRNDTQWLERAELLLWDQYDPEAALAEVDVLLRDDPHWIDALHVRCGALVMLERFEEALEIARQVATYDTQYGRLLEAQVLMDAGRWSEALTPLGSLVATSPYGYNPMLYVARCNLDGYADMEATFVWLARCFEESDGLTNGQAFLTLGDAYAAQGNLAEAARAYAQADALLIETASPLYALLLACLDAGRLEDAQKTLAEMQRRYPGWYATMIAEYVYRVYLGQREEALVALQAAQTKFPFQAQALLRPSEGTLRAELGQPEGLAILSELAEEQENPGAMRYIHLAYGQLFMDQFEEAEASLALAEANLPTQADQAGSALDARISLSTTRADLLLRQGDMDGAMAALEEAAALGWPPASVLHDPYYEELVSTPAYQALLASHAIAEGDWDLTRLPEIPEL
ncbi:MAG: tetratricopeptide repeat protein [Oscillospiraceae bacterium]|jgi:predicted Zn-dependent protease|nr:tetratricopeptide repeat protein [Oscillospiraceae bacterium]